MTMEEINVEISNEMSAYKRAYERSRETEGLALEMCERKMERSIENLRKLLSEKHELREKTAEGSL